MASKKKFPLSETVINLLLLIPNILGIIRNITTLINLEARLAGKAVVLIIIFSVIYAILLTSTWICLLALLFIYLTSLQLSTMSALLIILGLNVLSLAIIGLVISRAKKNLLFPETCQQCRSLCRVVDDE